jgi:hypothetical protein
VYPAGDPAYIGSRFHRAESSTLAPNYGRGQLHRLTTGYPPWGTTASAQLSAKRPSTFTARRTWRGRPSSYLSSTSARRYAGDEDNRASTSASASMMASSGVSITNLGDVRTATTHAYYAYFSITCLRRLSVATSRTIFLARLMRNPGTGVARSRMMSKRTRVLASPSGVRLYSTC